jgi:hypothetical protein
MKANKSKRYIINAKRKKITLKENSRGPSALNVILDIAGLIPGVGEYFDAINALLYARKGEWLLAALSLISAIPAVGDVIGKGGKLAIWVTKTFPKGAKATAKYGPKVIEAIKALKALIGENRKIIDAILDKANENKEMSKYVPKIQESLNAFSGSGKLAI